MLCGLERALQPLQKWQEGCEEGVPLLGGPLEPAFFAELELMALFKWGAARDPSHFLCMLLPVPRDTTH